jgi:hypothetical protein
MKRSKTRAVLLCLTSALGVAALAGCGSSSNSSSSTTAAKTAATTAAAAASTTTATTAAGSNGTTAPGTKLTPGTPAIVNYKPGVNSNSPTYRLQVTAVSIDKGSPSELNGVELEKAQQGQTPYYVHLRIRNEGAGNVAAEEINPAVGFQTTDDRGQPGEELTILGTFRTCETGSVPKQFTRGVTWNTCNLYLVGSGGSIVSASWTGGGGEAYGENPIVWPAG